MGALTGNELKQTRLKTFSEIHNASQNLMKVPQKSGNNEIKITSTDISTLLNKFIS